MAEATKITFAEAKEKKIDPSVVTGTFAEAAKQERIYQEVSADFERKKKPIFKSAAF